jgi:S-disulfanyl-L-cysteine oxidoreductase SoxD
MRSYANALLSAAAAATFCAIDARPASGQEIHRFDIGQVVTESEFSRWDIDIAIDGAGLPAGRGSVQEGKEIYDTKCLACHGRDGQGKPMDRLAGGQGTLKSAAPVKTIGSYWPYATTVFDYVRRAMPLDNPQSLTADEVYALTAYLLHLNGIVSADGVMDAQKLSRVRMPNESAFRADPRPDVSNTACERDCR